MTHDFASDLLWVAPEILKLPSRPARGTQKGDVFSFAIILQEFHTREGPYSANFMEPKGRLLIRLQPFTLLKQTSVKGTIDD